MEDSLQQARVVLVDAIERLQIGIVTNLLTTYSQRFQSNEALLLANCVLSSALLVRPIGDDATTYQVGHRDLVQREANELWTLPDVREALSHLYAALTIHLVFETSDPMSEPSIQLGDRATELGIQIADLLGMAGTTDVRGAIQYVATFSDAYKNRVLGR